LENEEFETVESVNDFMTPYLRQARFREAAFIHKVTPLWPDDSQFADDLHLRNIYDRTTPDEWVAELDCGDKEVGFLPALNNVTAVEVRSEVGQNFINNLEVYDTPCVWTPTARYYLFALVDPSALAPAVSMVPGLRFLGEREFMPYPGTMIEGKLVHWEISPDFYEPMELPAELRSDSTKAKA
jgi:hypothetical protein